MTDESLPHHDAMGVALAEAQSALAHGDVPVGAVVLHEGRVLAARHDERELRQDPTAHAELLALQDAAHALGSWRLDTCTFVVTLEPCVMCAGALVNARIGRVVYGATDLKAGGVLSLYGIPSDPRLNHNPPVEYGVRAVECGALLTSFFEARRSS